MKFARSLTTVAAATTLAFGAAIAAPTAGASDIKPEQIQGDATPSDVSALDIYAELEQYLPKDEAGQPSPSRTEYEAALAELATEHHHAADSLREDHRTASALLEEQLENVLAEARNELSLIHI